MYRLVEIQMQVNFSTIPTRCLNRSILYTNLSIEQLELGFNSKDKIVKSMIIDILSSTNLENTYYDLITNIKYYDYIHPDVTYKITVNEQ